eukprot:352603-Chlamydomonas_euryale.AAC.1
MPTLHRWPRPHKAPRPAAPVAVCRTGRPSLAAVEAATAAAVGRTPRTLTTGTSPWWQPTQTWATKTPLPTAAAAGRLRGATGGSTSTGDHQCPDYGASVGVGAGGTCPARWPRCPRGVAAITHVTAGTHVELQVYQQ